MHHSGFLSRRYASIASIGILALTLAACGGSTGSTDTAPQTPSTNSTADTPTSAEDSTPAPSNAAGPDSSAPGTTDEDLSNTHIHLVLDPGGVLVAIAKDQGYFGSLNVDYERVGYDAVDQVFNAKQLPIVYSAPSQLLEDKNQSEGLRVFSTAGGQNFINGVVVRAADADKYKTIEDLKGLKIGQPGFGTSTWATFTALAQANYQLDAQKDFKPVTADSGALLALLKKGDIDAAVLFSSATITALASPQDFKVITSFSKSWEDATGAPLLVAAWEAREDWLKDNKAAAIKFSEAIDKALEWAKENPDELFQGGKYEEWSNGAGWFATDNSAAAVKEQLLAGQYWLPGSIYNQNWIDANYEFLKETAAPEVAANMPPKEDLFTLLDDN